MSPDFPIPPLALLTLGAVCLFAIWQWRKARALKKDDDGEYELPAVYRKGESRS
jgi:hypothetical protein